VGRSGSPASEDAGPESRAAGLLRGLGLAGQPADPRLSRRLIGALLLLYLASFALFYPNAVTNEDESQFLLQTRLILEGRSHITVVDPLTGEREERWPSTYPPGTALLLAPLVWAGGWQAGFWLPCLSLLAALAITARWLHDAGRPPVFALLLLGFPPMLVMSRVAMSDVPSTALVALGLWLFWRGLDGGVRWWLGAGFVAGASAAVRIGNPLLFVPLFAGTLLRRDRHGWALVVGGLLGLGVRLASMQLFFGEAFYERGAYPFSPDTLLERLPLYLLGLLVLVPGGLALSFAYRGRRRPELLATLALIFVFYLFQGFSTIESGLAKRLVLALRYFLPLLPLLAFAMAEAVPRLWAGVLARRPAAQRRRLERWGGAALALWLVGVAAAAVAVHPTLAAWSRTQREILERIDAHVPLDAVVVTNLEATQKFLHEVDRPLRLVHRSQLAPEQMADLVERYGGFFVVLLDRSDSDWWRENRVQNSRFLEILEPEAELLLDRRVSPSDRLRIWRMGQPQAGPVSAGASK